MNKPEQDEKLISHKQNRNELNLQGQQLSQQKQQEQNANINQQHQLDNQQNIQVKLVNSVKQKKVCQAIAFNSNGSIMVAGFNQDIKVWTFQKGQLIEKKTLAEHQESIYCLVFSKKQNWFISGSFDYTIRCWKEQANYE